MTTPRWTRKVTLRRAEIADTVAIWRWNNAPEVRAASLDPRPIPLGAHIQWLSRRLADASRETWIVLDGPEPVGVLRVDPDAGASRVSIALDPAVRGRGIGRAAVIAAQGGGGPLVARILAGNGPSRRCFEAAGFRLERTALAADGTLILTYAWRCAHAAAG